MGIGDVQLLRAVDDVVRHVEPMHAAFSKASDVLDPLLFAEVRAPRARAREIGRVATDAAAAERLLGPIVEREPGLAPLLDAVRGARAVQEMPRPTRLAVGTARSELHRELQAVAAWKHVQPLDRVAREQVLERFRAGTADELDLDDWKTLAGIIGDDVDGTLMAGMPGRISSGSPIRELALDVVHQRLSKDHLAGRFFIGHQYWDAWKLADVPIDVRRARMDELLAGAPEDLTRAEWRELCALLNAGGHDVLEHPWFPGIRVEFGARHATLAGYETARKFSDRVSVEIASPAQLDAARAAVLAPGDLDDLATSIVQQGKLDRLGIVGEEAAAVRLRHLVPLDPAAARTWMVDVRAALERATTHGPTAQLRDTASELLDRNMARVDGERWYQFRDGYSNHPDYAELGRIRSIYQMLEQVDAIRTRPAAPPSAPPVVTGGERLTW